MTLDGKILWGLFEFKRIKPPTLRTSHGNVNIIGTIEASAKFRNNPIKIQILKHLTLLKIEHIYDYLNFMGTLQQGNWLRAFSIVVIRF